MLKKFLIISCISAALTVAAKSGTHAVFETRSPGAELLETSLPARTDTVEVWIEGDKFRLDSDEAGVSIIYHEDGDSLVWLHHVSKTFRIILGAVPEASAMMGVGGDSFVRGLSMITRFTDATIDSSARIVTVGGHDCRLYVMTKLLAAGKSVATTEVWVDPVLEPDYFEVGRLFAMANGSIPRENKWSRRLRAIAGFPIRTVVKIDSLPPAMPLPRGKTEQWLILYEEWSGTPSMFTIPDGYEPVDLKLRNEIH